MGAPANSDKGRRPLFVVSYISHAGLSGRWQYESQSAGRAGTVNVDLFNGNMVLAHSDTAMSGSRMPVSISHYYNSCQSMPDARDKGNKDPGNSWPSYNELYRCGHGFKHSGLQHIYETKVDSTHYAVWVDGNGGEHYFKIRDKKGKLNKDDAMYDSEGSGLRMMFHPAKGDVSEKLVIEAMSGTVMTFRRRMTKKYKGTWRSWWITSIRDHMQGKDEKWTNVVRYTYALPEGKHNHDNEKLRSLEGKLLSIKDASGRMTHFYYNDAVGYSGHGRGLLRRITAPGGNEDLSVDFVYDAADRLIHINYEELESLCATPHTRYSYQGDTNLLETVFNYEGTRVAVQYEQCDLNADFFDVAEGGDDDGTDEQSAVDSDAEQEEYSGKIGYNLRRAICVEAIREDAELGTARGSKRLFQYKPSVTEVTAVENVAQDATDGKVICYQFNGRGKLVSMRDELGFGQFIKYDNEDKAGDENQDKPTAVSDVQRAVINRIVRPTLIKDKTTLDSAWSMSTPQNKYHKDTNKGGNRIGFDVDKHRCLGCASMSLSRTTPDAQGSAESMKFSQTLTLPVGKRWTLSCYVKANHIVGGADGSGAFMRIYPAGDPNGAQMRQSESIVGSTEDAFSDKLPTDGWERMRMSYDTTFAGNDPGDTVDVVVEFVLGGESGSVYFAAPQLEEGAVANRVNLLSNGDFFLTKTEPADKPNLTDHVKRIFPVGWSADKGIQKEKLNKKKTKVTTKADYRIGVFNPRVRPTSTNAEGYNPYDLPGNDYDSFLPVFSGNYLQLRNGYQNKSQSAAFMQEMQMGGIKGDVFYAGGWASGKAMPGSTSGNVRGFRFHIQFYVKDKAGKWSWKTGKGGKHHFNPAWVGWQMQAGAAIAPANYSKVRVTLICKAQPLFTKFTNFFLHREEFGRSYTYDGKGNVITTTARDGQQSGAEYDAHGNLISYRKPGRPKKDPRYKMKYGSSEQQKKQHLLRETKTPMGMISTATYDKYGNTTSTTAKQKGGKGFIRAKVEYDERGNYAVRKIDARGNAVSFDINKDSGMLNAATDAAGTKVRYTYDDLKRLTRVRTTLGEGTTNERNYRNDYQYDAAGRMVSIRHNAGTTDAPTEVAYRFEYDATGARTKVYVGGNPNAGGNLLSESVYDETRRDHRLIKSKFANGGEVRNEYDDFGRVTAVEQMNTDQAGDSIADTVRRYEYEFGADGQVSYLRDIALGRTHFSEYDMAGRPCQSTQWDGMFDAGTDTQRGNLRYRTTLKYDKFSRLALFGERVPGKDDADGIDGNDDNDGTDNITTKYTYDKDDRLTTILYDEKAEERSVKYSYDGLGRFKTKRVCNGGEEIVIDEDEQAEDDPEYAGTLNVISYQYVKGGSGGSGGDGSASGGEGSGGSSGQGTNANAETALVSGITHGAINQTLSYEYDTLGNILTETCDLDNNRNHYQYDELGQLIRADVRNDVTVADSGLPGMELKKGTSWTYEYDLGGNMLARRAYEHNAGGDLVGYIPEDGAGNPVGNPAGEPIKTISYGYDADWSDKLVSITEEMASVDEDGNLMTTISSQQLLSYDAIGNVLHDGEWDYTWIGGRKLAQMDGVGSSGSGSGGSSGSGSGDGISGNSGDNTGTRIEFKYDAAGLRTRKRVTDASGNATDYDYYLHGKLLTHLTRTRGAQGSDTETDELHFSMLREGRS